MISPCNYQFHWPYFRSYRVVFRRNPVGFNLLDTQTPHQEIARILTYPISYKWVRNEKRKCHKMPNTTSTINENYNNVDTDHHKRKGSFELTILYNEDSTLSREEFHKDVLHGLTQHPKFIPGKYVYDDTGSKYFEQVTQLEEYYPWRAELDLFKNQAENIVREVRNNENIPVALVELGAGDGAKTSILLSALEKSVNSVVYCPIDISRGAMSSVQKLTATFYGKIHGIVADYLQGLEFALCKYPLHRILVMFVGSTIGNFSSDEAQSLISGVHNILRVGDIFSIGWDLKKHPKLLHDAYNDKMGITHKFYMSVLERCNRELGSNFQMNNFVYHASLDPVKECMMLYLIAQEDLEVEIPDIKNENGSIFIKFKKMEPVFVNRATKYDQNDVQVLLKNCGFSNNIMLYDTNQKFMESLSRKL